MTLEDFKTKAIDKFKRRILITDIDVEGYGLVPFNRPSDDDLLAYLNGAAKGAKFTKDGEVKETDITPIAEASKILVYNSCKFLHDADLQNEAEVIDPYDMPFKTFGIDATMKAAEKISDIFGSGEVQEEIKN